MSAQIHQPRVLAGRAPHPDETGRAPRGRDGYAPADRPGAGDGRDFGHAERLRRWRDRAALRR